MTDNPADWVRDLLKTPTDRDKQRTIGPSGLGNPCDKCLAEALSGPIENEQNRWWLGAKIGTAAHAYIETETVALDDPDIIPETKVTVGELEGYGVIKGTCDLYDKKARRPVDWKTTTREKLKWIKRALTEDATAYDVEALVKARYKVMGYIAQVHLYARGLIAAGKSVESVALVFLCRDGLTDDDIWGHTIPYSPELSDMVWNRAQSLVGVDPETQESDPNCFRCLTLGR